MRSQRRNRIKPYVLASAVCGLMPSLLAAQTTTLVSANTSGQSGTGISGAASISRTAQFVAFRSSAEDLIPSDTNGCWDIFVRDMLVGVTVRASVDSAGAEADGSSDMPAISGDGRYVAFESQASNLVPGDTNGCDDIFVHDLQTGQTSRVSVDSAGNQANDLSYDPSISYDGRFVCYRSAATNLVPGDTNGLWDMFVHDQVTGETTRVSVASDGSQMTTWGVYCGEGAISDDGRYVVFHTRAAELVPNDNNDTFDILVRDRQNQTTTRVSVASDGTESNDGSWSGAVSGDGRYVAFYSSADNLVVGDNNAVPDVFVHDQQTGETTRVSVDSDGYESNGLSNKPQISSTGRYVTFRSEASNLVPDDTNGVLDIFLHDRQTGETSRVSLTWDGQEADRSSGNLGVSPMSTDATAVAFTSEAGLVPEDPPSQYYFDVYLRERGGGCTPPSIIVHPESQAVCELDEVSFSVVAEGTEPLTYQWRKDGEPIPDATEATFLIASATAADAGVYDVTVTNACGTITSEPAELAVGTTITQQPVSQSVCLGASASFLVAAVAPEPITYQWRKDGAYIDGATDPTYTIDPVGVSDAADYDVVVTSVCGAVTSDVATLTVIEAVGIAAQPTDQTICVGSSLTLSVTASGGGTLGYQWRKDGQDLVGETDSTLHYDHAWEPDSGVYDVVVANECGSLASDPATVIVSPGVLITEHPLSQTVCELDQAAVTFTVAGDSPAPMLYQWYVFEGGVGYVEIPGETGPSFVIDPVTAGDAGRYRATVSDVCGPAWSDYADLAVTVPPVIETHPQSQAACQGATVVFEVVALGTPPLSYQWRKDGLDIPDATEETYTIEDVTPADAGDYDVVVTDADQCGEVISDLAVLTVTADVVPTITQQPASQTVCVDDDATFTVNADGTDLTYQWQEFISGTGFVDVAGATEPVFTIQNVTSGDSGRTFVVWVSNSCDAVRSIEVVLLVDDGVVTIVVPPSDQTGCETGTVTFEVGTEATPPLTYQWRKDSVEIPGATQSTLTLNDLTFSDAGAYDVVVTSTCGAATSDAAILTVIAYDPPIVVTPPSDEVVCEDGSVVLSVVADGAAPLEYQWRKDTLDIPGATNDSCTIDPFTVTDVGVYDVVITNSCGTVISDAALLQISRMPIIDRQPVDRIVATGEGVTFVVAVRGGALTYQWQKDGADIGGATASTYTIDTVATEDQGLYTVVVGNACGSLVSDTVSLTLVAPPRTSLVSLATGETQVNDNCTEATMSADGRFVAFVSQSNALVPGSWNDDYYHVYVRDRQSATTFQADANPHSWHTNGDSTFAAMSRDYSYIAFESEASNIVPGDTNEACDVYLLMKNTGELLRVSVSDTGEQGNAPSEHPSVSGNGYYAVFHSDADNLVPGDTNGVTDVFLYDRRNERLTRLSVGLGGVEANGNSRWASMSEFGRYVAFESEADNLVPDDLNGAADIFLHDRDPDGNGVFDEGNGVTMRVSVSSTGAEGNADSRQPALAPEGQSVAFESAADNLTPDDTNGCRDVFVSDWATGTMVLVSRADDGTLGDDDSYCASIACNGRAVAFLSAAANLVGGDSNGKTDVFLHDRDPDENGEFDEGNQTTIRASVASDGTQANNHSAWPMVSPNGQFVVFESNASNLAGFGADTNGRTDIFLYQVPAQQTDRVSLDNNGQQVYDASVRPFISGSSTGSQYVLFASAADTLIPGDSNAAFDIFSRNIQLDQTEMWTFGWAANANSTDPVVSADGRYVAFESYASNLVPGGTVFSEIFVRDMQTHEVVRVSVDSSGAPADDNSYDPAISSDGRYVAFASIADNLVPGDNNGTLDIFVHDNQTGATTRVSLSSTGAEANDFNDDPVISGDGRYVAFPSMATNLVVGDTNGERDIFVHDRQTGVTTRVSVSTGGQEANDENWAPAISEDGRYVAFNSWASNLAPGDNNLQADAFVHDLQTGETTMVSVNPDGASGSDGSGYPALSSDGRYIAFESGATDLVPNDDNLYVDVFVRDMQTGTTRLVSVDDYGAQGDQESSRPAISADGRYVAFDSDAENLDPLDSNGYRDVFVADWEGCYPLHILEHPVGGVVPLGEDFTLTVTVFSSSPVNYQWRKDGAPIPDATASSYTIESATESDGGVYDVEVSNDCNSEISQSALVIIQVCNPFTELATIGGSGGTPNDESINVSLSADGRFVAYQSDAADLVPDDTNNAVDVFLYDREAGQTVRINVSPGGDEAPSGTDSTYPVVSADGRYVAYCSSAENIVPGDNNNKNDIFVYDTATGLNVIASLSSSGQQGNDNSSASYRPVAISASGRFVAFLSLSSNLVPDDTNGQMDVFVRDRDPDRNGIFDEGNGVTERVSVDSSGNQTFGYDENPSISADGRFIAFSSNATTLVPDDTNGRQDVFVHDRLTGTTERVSVSSAGEEANGHSFWCAISGDGYHVAFRSGSSNLVPQDNGGYAQVYVHDRLAHETVLVSQNAAGQSGNDFSGHLAISTDGHWVAFDSAAENLVPDDNNSADDTFVRDTWLGETARVSVNGAGEQGNDDSQRPAISAGGEIVAFQSRATNLVPESFEYYQSIFIHTRGDCNEPYVLISPTSRLLPPGGLAAFSVQAGGNPPPTYQWRKDGVEIPDATGATLVVSNVDPDDAGVYDAVVVNFMGTVTSAPATLSVGILGDLNCDGNVNAYDIDGFICALSPTCDYEGMYPDCDRQLADCNGDGDVNAYDIDGFIELVGGG